MDWYKKNESWFADLPNGEQAVVSTGFNGKWHYLFWAFGRSWGNDPVEHPYEDAESAKWNAELIYKQLTNPK